MIPAGGGVFEVVVNGEKIYSKKETGKFPEPAAIVPQTEAVAIIDTACDEFVPPG